MIIKMKKVTILIKTSWMDDVLKALGEIGVVHLQPVVPLDNYTIENLKESIQLMEKALSIILERSDKEPSRSFKEEHGLVFAKQLLGLAEELKYLEDEIGMLEIECERLKVWGRFYPEEINRLREAGILIKLFKCHKRELSKIPKKFSTNIISEDGSTLYLAIVSKEKNFNIPLEEIEIPITGMDEIESMIKKKSAHLQHKQNEISTLYDEFPVIKRALMESRERLNYEEAKAGMGKEDKIAYLMGFCPETLTESLREMAGKKGWAILIEDPLPDDPVPTLLKHSKLTKIFQPVMNFIGIAPGYREFDTNGIFLIFFTVFFAMIIGDGGYGAIFLIATYIAGRFYKNISREKIILFYVLSITTIIWGAITGLWFGVESISQLPVLKELVIPSLYSYTQESESNIIRLCFLIGALQLSLARIWFAARLYPSLTALAQTGWAALVWGIYFIVRFLLLNEKLSIIALFLVGYWAVTLILFGEQREDGFAKGLFRGITNFLINVVTGIGCLSDLISYIRLFAIGLATREVAIAFNNMAGDIGFRDVKSIVIAIFILIFGHVINIMLGAMSVLVHGIRLNLLEFSKHLNIQWSGITYRPFKTERS
ncbi:MAG: V-type ATP synthase subunit I [Planctomycetota bacterium]|jgi:V/A-type H+-transporting ATPase subunit I